MSLTGTARKVALRPARAQEVGPLSALVLEVFAENIAPTYSSEGQRRFRRYAAAAAMAERQRKDHWMLIAEIDDQGAGSADAIAGRGDAIAGEKAIAGRGDAIAGVIEIRENRHVSLLFVRSRFHRQGVARCLFEEAKKRCLEARPELTTITVNSSPFAVSAYERMGFRATGPEENLGGVLSRPMAYVIENESSAKPRNTSRRP